MRMAVVHMGADGVIAEALWEAEVLRFTASQKGTHITERSARRNPGPEERCGLLVVRQLEPERNVLEFRVFVHPDPKRAE